ncbi:hypothetical protein BC628DRAFT_1367660 [Trametes gibbosa]|nr:hypothetical protein BC628DRAFT_1367660 [Trametes gibbosa]
MRFILDQNPIVLPPWSALALHLHHGSGMSLLRDFPRPDVAELPSTDDWRPVPPHSRYSLFFDRCHRPAGPFSNTDSIQPHSRLPLHPTQRSNVTGQVRPHGGLLPSAIPHLPSRRALRQVPLRLGPRRTSRSTARLRASLANEGHSQAHAVPHGHEVPLSGGGTLLGSPCSTSVHVCCRVLHCGLFMLPWGVPARPHTAFHERSPCFAPVAFAARAPLCVFFSMHPDSNRKGNSPEGVTVVPPPPPPPPAARRGLARATASRSTRAPESRYSA